MRASRSGSDWLTGRRFELKAIGRGSYCRTRTDASGRPRGHCTREKRIHGFQTGDLVRETVPKGKKAGTYVRRVAVRA
jgi:hypothetical protein